MLLDVVDAYSLLETVIGNELLDGLLGHDLDGSIQIDDKILDAGGIVKANGLAYRSLVVESEDKTFDERKHITINFDYH